MHYFCGKADDPKHWMILKITCFFHKTVSTFIRSYSDIAQDLNDVGYDVKEVDEIQKEVNLYTDIRSAIKNWPMKN